MSITGPEGSMSVTVDALYPFARGNSGLEYSLSSASLTPSGSEHSALDIKEDISGCRYHSPPRMMSITGSSKFAAVEVITSSWDDTLSREVCVLVSEAEDAIGAESVEGLEINYLILPNTPTDNHTDSESQWSGIELIFISIMKIINDR
jgi:hypothetical protein